MEIWFHAANVLYVVSYLVTDMLWLRALAVLGGFSSLTWTLTAPAPSATFIGWTLVYNTINVVQIARLWRERRPVRLTSEEQMLYAAAFRALTPREFQRLLAVGRWHEAPTKEVLIEQGACPRRMLVLASGSAAVKVDGREVAMLRRGQFAGEMSFLTGERTTAAVEVLEPVRFVSWATEDLERLLVKKPPLRTALQLILGRDLAAKVVNGRERT
jgi:Popeye protein conserved region